MDAADSRTKRAFFVALVTTGLFVASCRASRRDERAPIGSVSAVAVAHASSSGTPFSLDAGRTPSAPAPSPSAPADASVDAAAAVLWRGAEPVRSAAGDAQRALAQTATYRGAPLSRDASDAGADEDEDDRRLLAALTRADEGDGALAVWAAPVLSSEGAPQARTRTLVLARAIDAQGAFVGPVRLLTVLHGSALALAASRGARGTWVAASVQSGAQVYVHAFALRENGARVASVLRLNVVRAGDEPSRVLRVVADDEGGAWVLYEGSTHTPSLDEMERSMRANGGVGGAPSGNPVHRWLVSRIDASHHAAPPLVFEAEDHTLAEGEAPPTPEAELGLTSVGAWAWAESTRGEPATQGWIEPRAFARASDTQSHLRVQLFAGGADGLGARFALLQSRVLDRAPRWHARTIRLDVGPTGALAERTEGPWLPLGALELRCNAEGRLEVALRWQGFDAALDLDGAGTRETLAVLYRRFALPSAPVTLLRGDAPALREPGARHFTTRGALWFDGALLRRFVCEPGAATMRELGPR